MSSTDWFGMNANTTNSTMSEDSVTPPCDPFEEVNPDLLDVIRILQLPTFAVIFLISVSLNSLVLYLSVRYKLYQQELYLPLQIVAANLIFSLFVFCTNFSSAAAKDWLFGTTGCRLVAFAKFWFINVRFILMFVLALDRFLTVYRPFKYPKHSRKVTTVLSIATWVLLAPPSVGPFTKWLDCFGYSPLLKACVYVENCLHPSWCVEYMMVLCTLIVVIAGVVPLVLYCLLFRKARLLQNRVQPVGGLQERSWDRAASKKAAITFFLLFMALVGCVTPFFSSHVLSYLVLRDEGIKPPVPLVLLHVGAHALFISMPIADALAIMRNRDVRVVLHRMYQSFRSLGTSVTSRS